jgi:hypothetical protein
MLLVEHKAPHLYQDDAYKEYCWSVDQGAYQPASFIFLAFEGFRNLCQHYDLQLIDGSNCTQAQIETAKLFPPHHFLGLITRIENLQDVSEVQKALTEGKNVIALLPRALLDTWYMRDETRQTEATHAITMLGIDQAEKKLAYSFGYKSAVWWEEIATEAKGRLFTTTDGCLSDCYFKDGYGKSEENLEQIRRLLREFVTFKHPVIDVDIQPDIPSWPCHELLNMMVRLTNHGPEIHGVETILEIPSSFEPIGPLERLITYLDTLDKTNFTLPLIPRTDGNFQNIITVKLTSAEYDAVSLALSPTNVKITPSSGTGQLYRAKQDDLGLTTLQSIFKSLPDFPEIKSLPLLARTDQASCLNKMRIIAEKLTVKVLQKRALVLPKDFDASIRALQQYKVVSSRTVGYLHTIRVVGNSASHPSPIDLSDTDVKIASYALASVAQEVMSSKLIDC